MKTSKNRTHTPPLLFRKVSGLGNLPIYALATIGYIFLQNNSPHFLALTLCIWFCMYEMYGLYIIYKYIYNTIRNVRFYIPPIGRRTLTPPPFRPPFCISSSIRRTLCARRLLYPFLTFRWTQQRDSMGLSLTAGSHRTSKSPSLKLPATPCVLYSYIHIYIHIYIRYTSHTQ